MLYIATEMKEAKYSSKSFTAFVNDYRKELKEKDIKPVRRGEQFFLDIQRLRELTIDDFSKKLCGGHNNPEKARETLFNKIDKENNEYFFGVDSIMI